MKCRLLAIAAAVAAAAAGVVVVPIAVGSGARSDQGIPLLRIAVGTGFSSLDIARAGPNANAYAANLALETLMKLGPDGSVQPNLAKSVKHPNPYVYIYTLRKGVKFWDGNELTAVDVANALNYYRYPGSLAANYLPHSVRDIRATGRYTVQVTLSKPDASWPVAVTYVAAGIFEKKFADAHKGTMGQPGVLTMGTGPWEVDSLDPTRGIEMSANPHYWGGKVPIQHISFKFIADPTAQALAFRGGDVDLVLSINSPATFASTAGTKLLSSPSFSQGVFSMNTQVAPWNDVHVRRAVAYVLNRSEVIGAFSPGYAVPNDSFIPRALLRSMGSEQAVNAALKTVPKYPFSLVKARQEMAKSSYPNGFSTTFSSWAGTNQAAQNIASQLKAIGIDAKVDLLSVGAYLGESTGPVDKRRAQFVTASCTTPDPGLCYDWFIGSKNTRQGGTNFSAYAPAKVDALIKQGFTTVAPAKRLAVYGELLKQIATDVPFVPLLVRNYTVALSDKFTWPTFPQDQGFLLNHGPLALGIKPR